MLNNLQVSDFVHCGLMSLVKNQIIFWYTYPINGKCLFLVGKFLVGYCNMYVLFGKCFLTYLCRQLATHGVFRSFVLAIYDLFGM